MASSSISAVQGSRSVSVANIEAARSGVLALGGRILYALIFLTAGLNHFSKQTIAFAASQGVPLASFAVPLSGVIAVMGSLSIILGYRAKLGAWLLAAFLVPVTLMLHQFWKVTDSMMFQMQLAMFMKNVSMLGGALLIAYFGPGPLSLDRRAGR
jgi:putative oxidoreductase